MGIELATPSARQLIEVAETLRGWQADDVPLQLHPGDLGWHSMSGMAATAAASRVSSADGRILAIGMLDGPQLLRMAFDPATREEPQLVRRLVADLGDPGHRPFRAGAASVEARGAELLRQVLIEEEHWQPGELWVPFRRDLARPVEDAGLRIEVIDADRAATWVAVHWSAFRGTPMSDDDLERRVGYWRTMADGPLYSAARSLAAFDDTGDMVAVATVWSAGPRRPD